MVLLAWVLTVYDAQQKERDARIDADLEKTEKADWEAYVKSLPPE
jgi:hypothetical protein